MLSRCACTSCRPSRSHDGAEAAARSRSIVGRQKAGWSLSSHTSRLRRAAPVDLAAPPWLRVARQSPGADHGLRGPDQSTRRRSRVPMGVG